MKCRLLRAEVSTLELFNIDIDTFGKLLLYKFVKIGLLQVSMS